MPAEGMALLQNPAAKLSCEVFVGNIPPETQAATLQVSFFLPSSIFVCFHVCLVADVTLVCRPRWRQPSPCSGDACFFFYHGVLCARFALGCAVHDGISPAVLPGWVEVNPILEESEARSPYQCWLARAHTYRSAKIGFEIFALPVMTSHHVRVVRFIPTSHWWRNFLPMQEYLGGALVQVGLCKAPNPIMSIRMNARFAFLEMRTSEDATAALNLDGIPFSGAALSVGRPKKVTRVCQKKPKSCREPVLPVVSTDRSGGLEFCPVGAGIGGECPFPWFGLVS